MKRARVEKLNPWEQAKQNALYVLAKFKQITHKDVVKKIAVYVLNNPVHKGDIYNHHKLVYNSKYNCLVWEYIHNKLQETYPACTICLMRNIYEMIGGCKHGRYMGICVCCRKRGIITLDKDGFCESCENTMEYIGYNSSVWFYDIGMNLFNQNIPDWLKKIIKKGV
jgi:hypothetical protein